MILLNDFKAQWSAIRAEVLAATERVGQSGWLVLGEEVKRFEAELAKVCEQRFAVGVANGLDALEIAMRAVGIGRGDTVVTTPLSAFATTLAIVRIGAVPVFVDLDESGLIDMALATEAAAKHKAKAIIPVHLFGHAVSLPALHALANKGVIVIEDCAQSIGAKSGGKPVGSASSVTATSFYPTKNLGAYGDGGALLTSSEAIATKARSLRDYGQSAKYVHTDLGLNSRLDELQAAILSSALLPRLNEWTERRKQIAARYNEAIRSSALTLVPQPKDSESVWHLYPVLVKGSRDRFHAHLKERGVSSAVHYPHLIPAQPAMKSCEMITEGTLTRAQRFADTEVSLPIHPLLTESEIARVIEACNAWTG